MPKPITLTWLAENNDRVTEDCDLISEEDTLYLINQEFPLENSERVMASLMKLNLVYFQDEEGLFCLEPKQIIEIEMRE